MSNLLFRAGLLTTAHASGHYAGNAAELTDAYMTLELFDKLRLVDEDNARSFDYRAKAVVPEYDPDFLHTGLFTERPVADRRGYLDFDGLVL